jgi:transposase
MNQLNVSLQHSITTLAAHGWSHRRIARELDIHRETVGRHLRLAGSKPAKVLTGSPPDPAAKPAIPLAGGLVAGRQSLCVPLAAVIESAVQAGLSAQRIYQDLICDHGFTGGYHSVQRFVRQLLQTQPVPFVRMEVEPGVEAQVDFGQGAWVLVDGKRKRPHLFRIILSHSRKGYSEVVWQQTTESFIRCLENAFRYFGGVVRTLITDNLRAAVTRTDWYDPELNAKAAEFCRHYGTVLLPTRPAMPRHKGKIEAGIKFAQNNALKGRSFESLAAQNLFLSDWESGVADTRIHGTTRQQIGKVFSEVERPKLAPLPASLFPVFEEAPRTVHGDGYVELKRAYYSVPPEYVGRQVWARWEARLLRVFNQRREVIAVHVLGDPGKSGCAGSPACCGCSTNAGKSSRFTRWLNRVSSPPTQPICIRLIAGWSKRAWIIYWIGHGSSARRPAVGPRRWCNNAVPLAPASCMACWRWRKNIRSRPWSRQRKSPCITARGGCGTCIRCSNSRSPHHNWTFWKRIR